MKKKYKSAKDVPAKFAEFYVPVNQDDPDGEVRLNVEDDEQQADEVDDDERTSSRNELKSFRERNTLLLKQKSAMQRELEAAKEQLAQFQGIDPDKAMRGAKLIESQQSAEERKLLADGKFDDVIERRTNQMRTHYEREVAQAKTAAEQYKSQFEGLKNKYNDMQIRTYVSSTIDEMNLRLRPKAKNFLEQEIKGTFKLDEETNQLVAYEPDGSPKFSNKGKPYTVKDFIAEAAETTPYLFESGPASGGNPTSRQGNKSGSVVIDPNDPEALGRNAAALAKGNVIFKT